DPVELERMPDRLMDLQHHLVRHDHAVHLARPAVRRREQRERLVRAARAAADAAAALDLLEAALPRVLVAAHLRAGAVVRPGSPPPSASPDRAPSATPRPTGRWSRSSRSRRPPPP